MQKNSDIPTEHNRKKKGYRYIKHLTWLLSKLARTLQPEINGVYLVYFFNKYFLPVLKIHLFTVWIRNILKNVEYP